MANIAEGPYGASHCTFGFASASIHWRRLQTKTCTKRERVAKDLFPIIKCEVKTIDVATFGGVAIDVILNVERLPVKTQEHQLLTEPLRIILGGSANVLISAARLGATTAAIGFLPPPSDLTSDLLVSKTYDTLHRNKVNTDGLITDPHAILNMCAILTPPPPAEHTFLSTNEKPTPQSQTQSKTEGPLPPSFIRIIQSSRSLLIDGYVLMTTPHSQLLSVLAHAIASSTDIYFDPQTTPATPFTPQLLSKLSGLLLTPPAVLTLGQHPSLSSALHRLRSLLPRSARILLKAGGKHCTLFEPDRESPCLVPVFAPQRLVDTVGAGDAFAGAFLAGIYAHGWDAFSATVLANAMGAATCENRGTGEEGVGSVEAVGRILAQTEVGRGIRDRLGKRNGITDTAGNFQA